MDIFTILLSIVFIVVGIALVWFIVELIITIRKARITVTDVKTQLEPTLQHVEQITNDLQPVIKKIDPLADRVSLTIDAANLEVMRLDEILQDVSSITGSVSKTVETVDNVTSAPVDIVTNLTSKLRKRFGTKYASDETIKIGEKKGTPKDTKTNPIADFVDEAGTSIGEAIGEERVARQERADAQQAHDLQREANTNKIDSSAEKIVDATLSQVDSDTDSVK